MFKDINTIRREGERVYNTLPKEQRPADRELFIREYVIDYLRDDLGKYKGTQPTEHLEDNGRE